MLNRKGEVIGILTGNFGSAQEIALCTPIGAALALVKDEMGPVGASLRGRPSLHKAVREKGAPAEGRPYRFLLRRH